MMSTKPFVLYVEDDKFYRKSFLSNYQQIFEVIDKDSFESALLFFLDDPSNTLDLIVLDWNYGGLLNGVDLAKVITKLGVSTPIIIVSTDSGKARKDLYRRGMQDRVYDVIEKGIPVEEMLQSMKEAIRTRYNQ